MIDDSLNALFPSNVVKTELFCSKSLLNRSFAIKIRTRCFGQSSLFCRICSYLMLIAKTLNEVRLVPSLRYFSPLEGYKIKDPVYYKISSFP